MSFALSRRNPFLEKPLPVAIVRSQFNSKLVEELMEKTMEGLAECGISAEFVSEFLVPGALEIPGIVRQLQNTKKFAGIITLGVVIRGDTNHYEIVTEESSRGLMDCTLQSNIPVINGILGGENINQVEMRLEKGIDFAKGLVEMMVLKSEIEDIEHYRNIGYITH